MKLTSLLSFLLIFLLFSCNDNGNNSMVSQESPQKLATVTTNPVTGISGITAYTGGDVSDDGGFAVKERGVCYSTKKDPTVSDSRQIAVNGARLFFNYLSGLKPGTLYYLRAYATTSAGTAYGATEIFKTLNENIETGTVTDRDGNVYVTVKIGDQWWMAENLKTTRFRNGNSITRFSNEEEWSKQEGTAFCSPDFETGLNLGNEGYLYNEKSVNDLQSLAPEGWHIPTNEEWQKLIDFAGGRTSAGANLFYKLNNPLTMDIQGLNSTGFSARHTRYIFNGGVNSFSELDDTQRYTPSVGFWSSEKDQNGIQNFYLLSSGICQKSTFESQKIGLPIRCIKD